MECEYGYFDMPGNLKDYLVNKDKLAKDIATYFLARLQSMFEYKNLPDTIEPNVLDRFVMVNGISCITDVNDKLYVFRGNLGGVQDVYYRPTRYTVANPALDYTAFAKINSDAEGNSDELQFTVGHEGVLVRNDSIWIGMQPLMARYATMLAENLLTMRTADVMLRVTALISAADDKTRIGAEMYIRKLEKGELSIVAESPFFDGLKSFCHH